MDKDRFSKIVYTINENTGEIVDEFYTEDKTSNIVLKNTVDKMLANAKVSGDLDGKLLYQWCRIIRAINSRNQIQTIGNKLNDDIEDLLVEQGIVCSYVLKVIKLAHPFTHILKKSKKSQITTWTELWEIIGCKDSVIRKRVRTFLELNKLIKVVEIKAEEDKRKSKNLFVLNPYLYKNASHAGQLACVVWQESAKPNININFYAYMWLVSQDVIIFEDDKDYEKIINDYINKFINKKK